jgi:RNA polymerase sigma-70 factor (ECF subfamily)
MGRANANRPGHPRPGAGLRVLAELINEALVATGAWPAFAIAGGAGADRPLLQEQSALESATSVARPKPSPGKGRGARGPQNGPGREPPEPSSAIGADVAEVDETHAETWQLVRLAQAGDGDAFGQLYDRYVDMVFRFIYFRVNDRALAEDFTSETFLRALRRIGSISYQGRDIGAWFVTIARNIVLDHLKSARHRLETTTADTLESKEHVGSTEEAVLDVLQSQRLMQAVGQLGDEQRECVMLRFVHGLSVSETAQVMGKNDGAIKALQHRAVRKLADLVGGDLR